VCGIVGVFCHDGGAAAGQLDVLPGLIELMARRGPDEAGDWTDGDHLVLGFRRLAVIDPTPAGHQPMVTPDGRHVLVFNGEVYNFAELRGRLEGEGVRFRSRSDTEVVLHAIVNWGTDAFARFNGMFALACYDRVTRTLLLARDPMGVKPLHYLTDRRGLVFGSQYDQLLRHPWCDRSALRDDVLGLYLRLGYVPPPYGLVRNTHHLEPGTFLRVQPGREPELAPFRRFADAEPPPLLRGAEADEAVAATVDAAVRRQLVSDVPTGTMLSGGVDSPLVAAAMQAASPSPVPAFTVGSTDANLDESTVARSHAQRLGVDHHLRMFDAADSLALLDDMALAFSEPFADHSALPTMLVSSMARERVTVALSGDGGDELFWGYPRFRKVLGARRWFTRPRAVRAGVYAARKWAPGARPPRGVLFPSIGDWYLDSHSGLRAADLAGLCPTALPMPDDFALYDLAETPDEVGLAQWLRANELKGHLQMLLAKVDRASMFYGLEMRVPLLDLDVADCAGRLHPDSCIDGDTGKVVLRRALARYVPAATIAHDKRGFDVPVGSFLRGALAPRVRDLLLDRDPFPEGLFSRPALRTFVESHLDGTHDRTQGLWNLFSLQLWADTHLRAPAVHR
jgi:asparagine synthase (glutamine-hydrolysing)